MTRNKEHKARQAAQEAALENVALTATKYIGSLPSLIIHTLFFVGIFALSLFGYSFEAILLILTTVVSLEAIYLSIFIQMTVNKQSQQIALVSEDVEEISEDVEEISKDIDDIQEDVEEISKDIDDIQEDVEGISEDVEEISEDVEEISEELEEDEREEAREQAEEGEKIQKIEAMLAELLSEVKNLKDRKSD